MTLPAASSQDGPLTREDTSLTREDTRPLLFILGSLGRLVAENEDAILKNTPVPKRLAVIEAIRSTQDLTCSPRRIDNITPAQEAARAAAASEVLAPVLLGALGEEKVARRLARWKHDVTAEKTLALLGGTPALRGLCERVKTVESDLAPPRPVRKFMP